MAEADDEKRGEHGVVVSVREDEDGSIRLVFDRATRNGSQWQVGAFVTAKQMARDTLLEMSMSDEDLNSFGLVLTAELCAALKRIPR